MNNCREYAIGSTSIWKSRLDLLRRNPPYYRKAQRAISWFKQTAVDHVAKMHEMTALTEARGIKVSVLTTGRVGYAVYEDEFQIVAEPFADTE